MLHDKKLIFERLGDIERLDLDFHPGSQPDINRNYIRKLNTKDCICSLVTPDSTYHLPIPKGACDMLSDLCLRHEK